MVGLAAVVSGVQPYTDYITCNVRDLTFPKHTSPTNQSTLWCSEGGASERQGVTNRALLTDWEKRCCINVKYKKKLFSEHSGIIITVSGIIDIILVPH